jgi:hypothetical protein
MAGILIQYLHINKVESVKNLHSAKKNTITKAEIVISSCFILRSSGGGSWFSCQRLLILQPSFPRVYVVVL